MRLKLAGSEVSSRKWLTKVLTGECKMTDWLMTGEGTYASSSGKDN